MAHGPPARKKTTDALHAGDEHDEELDDAPPPPDGGWGWVVVFGSFMIHVITDGMTYSFGIFYKEFLNEFKEGAGYTAWIMSLLAGVTLCSGPISSSIVNRFGCRTATIVGAILAGSCLIVSVWAKSVLFLIFTIGFGTGFGLGLIYVPAIVSVTTYFEKYRSLATGIAVCGSGAGTFIGAPLTEMLVARFGWRGAMLWIAAIVLNCTLFGALFRPLEAPKRVRNAEEEEEEGDVKRATGEEMYDVSTPPQQLSNGHLAVPADPNRRSSLQKSSSFKSAPGDAMVRSQSVGHSLVKGQHRAGGQRVHYDDNHNGNDNGNNGPNATQQQQNGNGNGHSNGDETMRSALSQPFLNDSDRLHFRSSHRSIAKSGTMSRPDILYQGSLYNIANYRSTHDVNSCGVNGGVADVERYGSFQRIAEVDETTVPATSRGVVATIVRIMHFDLFCDPVFCVFTFSNFCTSIGFNVPYVYLVVQAETLGISATDASHLIAAIGIANTVGRIVLGYLSDKPWVNRLTVYNVCLTSCGIATALSIFCTGFNSLVLFAVVFGFTIGAYVGLTSVILVDLIGLDKLTNAFGLLLLFQGIASLIGPPIAGSLYDMTQSYLPGFFMAGVTIAISGFVLFAIPPMQRHLARRQQQIVERSEGGR